MARRTIRLVVDRQPLYLKLLFEEVKFWRSYDPPRAPGDGVPALLEQLFDRLSQPENHGPSLVQHGLGYLATARRGLSDTEILEVLFADRDYKTQLDQTIQRYNHTPPTIPPRIPFAIWSRLRSDLAPYLTERAALGGNVLTLYHRQVAECIKVCFIDQSDWKPHERLAEYFTKQKYLTELDEEQRLDVRHPVNVRKMDEVRWQCVQSHQYDRATGLLQDLDFLSPKIEAELVDDLLNDYQCVQKDSAYRRSLDPWREFAQSNAQVFGEHPELVFQQACNEAKGSPVSLAAWKRWERRFEIPSVFAPSVAFLEWTNRPDEWFPAACRFTLAGHEKSVGNVTLSADGTTLVSGSGDKMVKIWNAVTGRCIDTFTGHEAKVTDVALSEDETLLVSGSYHRVSKIKVWNVRSRDCHDLSVTGPQDSINGLALSAEGERWQPDQGTRQSSFGTSGQASAIGHLPATQKWYSVWRFRRMEQH